MVGKYPEVIEQNIAEISGPQMKALCVLASGGLKKQAAVAADVCPQAVSEWMKLPHFREALTQLRSDLVRAAGDELRALAAESFLALRDVLHQGTPALRLRAASYVIDRILIPRLSMPETAEIENQAGLEVQMSGLLQALGVAK